MSFFYPRLDAILSINRNRDIDGAPGPNDEDFGMLQLQWNIFRGGGDLARQEETAYQLDQASDIRARTFREVIETSRLAWSAMIAAQARIPALRAFRYSASQTVKAYDDQFKIGKRTLLDLLDAEDEWFNARVSYVNDRYTLMIEKYRLLSVMGRLFDYFNIPLPIDAHVSYAEPYLYPRVPDIESSCNKKWKMNRYPYAQNNKLLQKRFTSKASKKAMSQPITYNSTKKQQLVEFFHRLFG